MAGINIYLLNTAASAPNWFGRVQDGGSAPAGALSAFGWTVAKVALTTPYWRGRIGATARATAATAGSYIESSTGPVQGTGSGATTAGDSFRSDNPLSGTFAAGIWAFTFGMRTGAASNSGRVRFNLWASTNADGSSARRLTNPSANCTTVLMNSATATFNSTLNYNAPEWILNNEYLFLQVEWQSTVVGTSNSCTAQFYQASFVTTNYVAAIQAVSNATGSPVFGEPDLGQEHVLGTSEPCVAGSPVFDAPTLAIVLPAELVAVSLGGAAPVLWGDTGTSVSKANGGLDAVATGGGWTSARGDTPRTAGKLYCELEVLTTPGGSDWGPAPGIMDATTPAGAGMNTHLVTNSAATRYSDGYPITAGFFTDPSPFTDWGGSAPAIGMRFGIAADLDTGKLFLAKENNWTTGSDPATGTSPRYTWSAPHIGDPLYPCSVMIGVTVRIHSTVETFLYAPPTGYSAWAAAAAPPVLGTPTLSVQAPADVLVAQDLVVASLDISSSTIVQAHKFIAQPLAVSTALAFSAPSFKQAHAFQAIALAVQPPTCAAAVATITRNFIASDLAVPIPSFGTPAILPITLLVPSNLATAPPPAVTATLGQKHVIGPTAFALTSPPAFAAAAFTQRHSLIAIVPVIPPPILGVCVSGQIHVLNATLLAVDLPVFGAAVLGQAGVMAAIPAAAGAPIIAAPVFGQRQLIAAINPAINPPVFSAASFAQRHLIAATFPAIIPATFGQPALAQAHALATGALIVAPPVYGTVVLGQAGVMAALPIAVTAPTVGAATLGQKHVAIAQPLAPSPPTLGAPALSKLLQAAALTISNPTLGASSLGKVLTAAPVGAGPPSLGTPACTLRVFDLTASSLAIGPPVLPALSIGQSGVMAAVPAATGAPVLGAPAIGQRHVLLTAVAGVTVGAPTIGQGNFGRSVNLGAATLAIGVLAIGAPKLGQHHVLAAVPAAAGTPAYGVVLLGQAGVMAAVPLWLQGPALPVLTPIQRHSLAAAKLAVGAPALGVSALVGSTKIPRPQSTFAGRFRPDPAVLGQGHQLNAQAASAGAPKVLPALFFEGETFPPVSLAVSAPILGAPALAPVARFTAIAPAPRPVLGQPNFSQEHKVAPRDLSAGRPILTRPRLGEPAIDLDPIGLAVEAPIAAVAVLKVVERLLAVVDVTGRPHLTVITGQRGSTPTISNTQRAAPLTGKRTANTITSRKQRTVI